MAEATQVREAGRVLALLHSLHESISTDGSHLREGCGYPQPRHVQFFADRVRNLVAGHDRARTALDEVLAALAELDERATDSRVSTVHGDYHPANLIVCNGQIAAVCDFDLVLPAPSGYDLGYFLYRAAGRPSRSEGGVARIDRAVARAFLDGYVDCRPALPLSRSAVACELRRFALYDCLLEANNTGDPVIFEAWASDAMALEGDLERWLASPT